MVLAHYSHSFVVLNYYFSTMFLESKCLRFIKLTFFHAHTRRSTMHIGHFPSPTNLYHTSKDANIFHLKLSSTNNGFSCFLNF